MEAIKVSKSTLTTSKKLHHYLNIIPVRPQAMNLNGGDNCLFIAWSILPKMA
jgi:hypothetical protein